MSAWGWYEIISLLSKGQLISSPSLTMDCFLCPVRLIQKSLTQQKKVAYKFYDNITLTQIISRLNNQAVINIFQHELDNILYSIFHVLVISQ